MIQDEPFAGEQHFYNPDENWLPEFFGDTPAINGAVQPYLSVGGGAASEGVVFDKPVRVMGILLLPAERADVIADFSSFNSRNLVLRNLALPAGVVSPATPDLTGLMRFRVRGPVRKEGSRAIPTTLKGVSVKGVSGANLGNPAKKRYITLEEILDPVTGMPVRLEVNGRMFGDPVDGVPSAGSIEGWYFVNISADTSPILGAATTLFTGRSVLLAGSKRVVVKPRGPRPAPRPSAAR